MSTSIFVVNNLPTSADRGSIEVTCPVKPAISEQIKLLADFKAAGLRSQTPNGAWLPDREYSYTTLIFKATGTEDVTSLNAKIKSVIAENPEFEIEDDTLSEAVSNTAVNSINDMLTSFFGKAVGVNANEQNIVYDTKVDVEAGEVTVYAYTTTEASDNDTKQFNDVITQVTAELKKRNDIKSVTKSTKEGTTKLVIKLVDSSKLLTDRISESIHSSIDSIHEADDEDDTDEPTDDADVDIDAASSIELFPAVLSDGTIAAVIKKPNDVVDEPEDGPDFVEACGKIKTNKLMHEEEDDAETLSDNFDADNCVIIRAPESVAAADAFAWLEKLGTTLEAVGFDVTLNMDADTPESDFEQIPDDADTSDDDEPEAVTESDSSELKQTYDKMYADFKAGKLSPNAWQKYCADTLIKIMQDNADVFKRLKDR